MLQGPKSPLPPFFQRGELREIPLGSPRLKEGDFGEIKNQESEEIFGKRYNCLLMAYYTEPQS